MREVEGARLEAQRQLASAARPTEQRSEAELRALVGDARRLARKLAKADRDTKAELYAELGLVLTYEPSDQAVRVSVPLVGDRTCRRGDLNPHALIGH